MPPDPLATAPATLPPDLRELGLTHPGPVHANRPVAAAAFDRLLAKTAAYLQGRPLFLTDAYACADPRHRLNVRVVAEKAWHTLFARCLFLRTSPEQLATYKPDWTVISAPDLHADPG